MTAKREVANPWRAGGPERGTSGSEGGVGKHSPAVRPAPTLPRAKFVHHVNIQTTNRSRTKEWYERVFGAEAIERGNVPNRGQLQVKFGTWEIHFSETTNPIHAPLVHFAVEVDDWDEMLAHLDRLGVAYGKTVGPGRAGTFRESRGGDDPRQGRREHDGSHYTYTQDPDGNVIELVYHPNG